MPFCRTWRYATQRAGTVLKRTLPKLSTAMWLVKASMLMLNGLRGKNQWKWWKAKTWRIWRRLISWNSFLSTRNSRGPMFNILDSILKQIQRCLVNFFLNISKDLKLKLKYQGKSLSQRFSLYRSTLTRRPLTTSRETRRSSLRRSWAWWEALWASWLDSPSSVALRPSTFSSGWIYHFNFQSYNNFYVKDNLFQLSILKLSNL